MVNRSIPLLLVSVAFLAASCGGGSPEPSCRASGEACAVTADCCSTLACVSGACATPCAQSGESCATGGGSTCCSGLECSSAGQCVAPPSCGGLGHACAATADCCSQFACVSGRCGLPHICRQAGATCSATSDCCSSLECSGGVCRDPAACRTGGQSCATTNDCCGALVCYSGACVVAGMTWSIQNQHSTLIYVRFFDQTAQPNFVWPDDQNAFYLYPGQTGSYPLACAPGHVVCYGAEDQARTGYWGVGLDEQYQCTSCCAPCDGKVYAESLQ